MYVQWYIRVTHREKERGYFHRLLSPFFHATRGGRASRRKAYKRIAMVFVPLLLLLPSSLSLSGWPKRVVSEAGRKHTLCIRTKTTRARGAAACWPGAIKVYCRQMSLFRPVPRFPLPLHREVKIAPVLSCIPPTRVYCIRFVASEHCEMADNQQPQMGGRMLLYIMKINCTGYQSLKLILTDRRSVTVRLKRNQEKPFVVN